jgi:hypothetical protein
MFRYIEFVEYFGYNKETNEYSYLYKIADTDFEWQGSIVTVGRSAGTSAGSIAVINCYKEKNLNVPKNLWLLIKFMCGRYGYKIKDYISWCKEYNQQFSEYEKEIENYLLLT